MLGDVGLHGNGAGNYTFMYGHALHAYWKRIGKSLVVPATGELL